MSIVSAFSNFFFQLVGLYAQKFFYIGCIYLSFTIIFLAIKVIKMVIPHSKGCYDD